MAADSRSEAASHRNMAPETDLNQIKNSHEVSFNINREFVFKLLLFCLFLIDKDVL